MDKLKSVNLIVNEESEKNASQKIKEKWNNLTENDKKLIYKNLLDRMKINNISATVNKTFQNNIQDSNYLEHNNRDDNVCDIKTNKKSNNRRIKHVKDAKISKLD